MRELIQGTHTGMEQNIKDSMETKLKKATDHGGEVWNGYYLLSVRIPYPQT